MSLNLKVFIVIARGFSAAILPLLGIDQNRSGRRFSAAAFALWLLSGNAWASNAQQQIEQAINAYLRPQIAQYTAQQGWHHSEHSSEITLLSSTASLEPCTQPLQVSDDGESPSILARQRLRVACPDTRAWQRSALITINLRVPAVHAARDIARGQTLSAEDVQLEPVTVTRNLRGFYTQADEVAGQGAKRRIRAGQLLSANLLSTPLLIRRGQAVTIVANQHGINAQVAGQALANGRLGEIIRVRNVSSDKVIDAQVIEDGVVSSVLR